MEHKRKKRFKTLREAEDCSDYSWSHAGNTHDMPLRVYKCTECPYFHLTSQPE